MKHFKVKSLFVLITSNLFFTLSIYAQPDNNDDDVDTRPSSFLYRTYQIPYDVYLRNYKLFLNGGDNISLQSLQNAQSNPVYEHYNHQTPNN